MFGLEGSGFIISLAMTFFLVGLVMYYVRQRLNDQEKQLNQLVSIIPVMSQQLQLHENILKNNKNEHVAPPATSSEPLTTIPEEPDRINVSDNDDSDTDDSDGSDGSDDSDDSDEATDNIKNIKLGNDIPELTVADIETELGNQLQAMAMQEAIGQVRVVSVHAMGPSNVESLEDLGHNIEIIDEKASLSVEDNNHDDVDDDDDDDDDDDSDDDSEDDTNNESDKIVNLDSFETVKTSDTSTTDDASQEASNVDYSKMAVAALREIVVSKNLTNSADVSKLKKKKLLELLK